MWLEDKNSISFWNYLKPTVGLIKLSTALNDVYNTVDAWQSNSKHIINQYVPEFVTNSPGAEKTLSLNIFVLMLQM